MRDGAVLLAFEHYQRRNGDVYRHSDGTGQRTLRSDAFGWSGSFDPAQRYDSGGPVEHDLQRHSGKGDD